MHGGGGKAPGQRPGGAQRIAHQGAPARPELDEAEGSGLAHGLPDDRAPQSDQLPEHLADLRSSDEVAGSPDRIARGVVAVEGMRETGQHEPVYGHRPIAADAL